jgi:hypothetical protein
MYADEYLPADDAFDMDDMDVSIDESSSMNTDERERKINIELYKRMDPDYYSYKRLELDARGEQQIQRVRIYSSRIGGMIRNAPSGIREEHRVGAPTDNLYFVVKDTALYTKTDTNTEARKLYYRNPEEFERHHHIQLPGSIKSAWHQKYLLAKSRQ